ncbi:hypothetical protein V8F20_001078 [Naviculisporaceae sp. PSN 640]
MMDTCSVLSLIITGLIMGFSWLRRRQQKNRPRPGCRYVLCDRSTVSLDRPPALKSFETRFSVPLEAEISASCDKGVDLVQSHFKPDCFSELFITDKYKPYLMH